MIRLREGTYPCNTPSSLTTKTWRVKSIPGWLRINREASPMVTSMPKEKNSLVIRRPAVLRPCFLISLILVALFTSSISTTLRKRRSARSSNTSTASSGGICSRKVFISSSLICLKIATLVRLSVLIIKSILDSTPLKFS